MFNYNENNNNQTTPVTAEKNKEWQRKTTVNMVKMVSAMCGLRFVCALHPQQKLSGEKCFWHGTQ